MLLKLVGALGGVVFHRGMARTAGIHVGMAVQVVVQTAGDVLALGYHFDTLGHELLYRGQEDGVVGAAQDEGIDGGVGLKNVVDALLDEVVGTRSARLIVLDDGHPEGARHTRDGDIGR